jgi:uncharacterized protein (UPF0218 family)
MNSTALGDDDAPQTEHDKLRAEISKLIAETIKIGAETSKIQAETRWYPLVAVGAFVTAAVAAVGLLVFKLVHG